MSPAVAELIAAAEIGLNRVEVELACFLESACFLNDDLEPLRDTLGPDDEEHARALEDLIERIRAAILAVRGAA
jgi:sugar (pentulose or hexulose) kinase